MSRRAVLLEALAATPTDLARMLRRVERQVGMARPDSDGPSIVELAARMVRDEPLHLAVFRRAAAEHRPEVAALPAGPIACDPEPAPAELAAQFAQARAATLAFLGGLEQAAWARWLVYAGEPIRLREQVQALVTQDNQRLAQIADLRELIT